MNLTPPEVAKRLRVKPSKVLGWIRSGELEAVDVSTRPGIGRPRFRVSAEALERFAARRAVRPAVAAKPPKQKPAAARRWF